MKNVSEIMFRWCLTYDAVYIIRPTHTFPSFPSLLVFQFRSESRNTYTESMPKHTNDFILRMTESYPRALMKRNIYHPAIGCSCGLYTWPTLLQSLCNIHYILLSLVSVCHSGASAVV